MAKDFHKFWTDIKQKFKLREFQTVKTKIKTKQTEKKKKNPHVEQHIQTDKVVVRFNWKHLVQHRDEEKKHEDQQMKNRYNRYTRKRIYSILLGKSYARQKTTFCSFCCCYYCLFSLKKFFFSKVNSSTTFGWSMVVMGSNLPTAQWRELLCPQHQDPGVWASASSSWTSAAPCQACACLGWASLFLMNLHMPLPYGLWKVARILALWPLSHGVTLLNVTLQDVRNFADIIKVTYHLILK